MTAMIDSAVATVTSPLEDARSQLAEAAGHLGLSSGLHHQTFWWSADEVETRREGRMLSAWEKVVCFSAQEGLTLRAAATTMAVSRVAEAHNLRGLYP